MPLRNENIQGEADENMHFAVLFSVNHKQIQLINCLFES